MRQGLMIAIAVLAAGCGADRAEEPAAESAQVESSGKQDVGVADLPEAVRRATLERAPGVTIREAESETRDGRSYFDVGGTMPDGSEIEFDMMQDGDTWRIVETQRDIEFAEAPEPVRRAAAQKDASLAPTRVIESRQEDEVVIYELYAAQGGDPQGRKLEIKWDGREASVLDKEWAH